MPVATDDGELLRPRVRPYETDFACTYDEANELVLTPPFCSSP